MEHLRDFLCMMVLLIGFLTQEIGCMGLKGSKQDPEQDSESLDYDPEDVEPGEMIDLIRDQWEVYIQRDLCPWAECNYCSCNGRRPTCSETPPTEYRGPINCKEKSNPGLTCFFRGGEPKRDCMKQNRDYGLCFPEASATNEYTQQICLAYLSDCENLVDFCNCTRACAMTRLPTQRSATSSPIQTTAIPIATVRRTAPPNTPRVTTSKSAHTMHTRQGSIRSSSDSNVSKTTGTTEGSSEPSISPDLQDISILQSMLSTVGVLALSFGGLVLVCFVFVVMLVCSCTCKKRRGPATFKHSEQHAYHYVDVDTLGRNGQQGTIKPVITNPVYNVRLPEDHEDVGAVYSEAHSDNFIILSTSTTGPRELTENQYAECRPRSHNVSTVPTEVPSPYMELDEDSESGSIQKAHLYIGLPNPAVYTDLQFGGEPESSETTEESESETTESSTEPDETDTSSGSGISMSSADSGMEDQRNNISVSDFEGDNSHNATTSDFEGDNAHYFEANTLPLSVRKSNDSLASREIHKSINSIPEGIRKEKTPMTIEENPIKKSKSSDYQKLRCQHFTKDRSFSIDSACSDNTYNSLTPKGTLTLAESDGKYSTLVRKGKESKKRENESSDSDNMYSELSRGKSN